MMSIAGLLALSLLGPAQADEADAPAFTYPEARRGDVIDTYHGVEVADPYRWLEAPDSEETRAWVDGQVALTTEYLSAIPAQQSLKDRLAALWNLFAGNDLHSACNARTITTVRLYATATVSALVRPGLLGDGF